MEENSGRATDEGSLSQHGQTCNQRRMYGNEKQNHSLQVAFTIVIKITQTCSKAAESFQCVIVTDTVNRR